MNYFLYTSDLSKDTKFIPQILILTLLILILTSLNANASCLLDDLETGKACTIAEFQKKMDTTYTSKPMINEFSGSPEARLKPYTDTADKKMLREFGPKTTDFGYNADCQFGVCKDFEKPTPFNEKR